MPCSKCDSTIIYIEDYETCPKCEHVLIVPLGDSLKIHDCFSHKHDGLFLQTIKKCKKKQIISSVFWQREKLIRKFNSQYSTLNVETLFSCNLLIRRLITHGGFLEQEDLSESDIEKLIRNYGALARFAGNRSRLESGTWNMVCLAKYDLNRLENLSFKDIMLFRNEKHDQVMDTFHKHNLMSAKEADTKLEEWKKDFVPVELGSKQIHSTHETISTFYELISMLYVAFFHNNLYSEAFGLPDAKNIAISSLKLKQFVSLFPIHDDGISACKTNRFFEHVNTLFEGKSKQFFSNFVVSEENPKANPLFLQIDDLILISQTFTELYCYVLHAIIDKNTFDLETRKRSKIFESKIVKERFEGLRYRYLANYEVKNKLEIDGIAISDYKVYVIEVKGWGSRRLLEEKSSEVILTRDIKNSIDGKHFVHKTNKTRTKVSLPKKVIWVKKNYSKFNIPKNVPVSGLLVINEAPTIPEYNGCKIIFINDFESLNEDR